MIMADKSKLSREEMKKAAGGQSADRARPDKTAADLAGKANADVMTDADLATARGGSGASADRARPDKSLVDPYVKPNADRAGSPSADTFNDSDKAGS
jgi:hypothetical protein